VGSTLAGLVLLAAEVYTWVIIIRALLSWIPARSWPRWLWRLEEWLEDLTEPLYRPLRRLLPLQAAGIDFTPLVAFFIVQLVAGILARLLQLLPG